MGRQHVLTGWIAGALTGQAMGLPPAGVVGFGVVAAGASGLNDLDHDEATATRAAGVWSRILAELVQFSSRRVYQFTRGPGDARGDGEHRFATHSLPLLVPGMFLVTLMPWLVTGAARVVLHFKPVEPAAEAAILRWTGPATAAVVVLFCVLIAANRLGSWLLLVPVGCILVLGVRGDPAAAVLEVWPWLAVAMFVGVVTHCLGDLVTEYGLPLWAPLYVRNRGLPDEQRWVRIQLPGWLAFRAGGWFETAVVAPVLGLAAVLVTPGIWPAVVAIWRAVQGV